MLDQYFNKFDKAILPRKFNYPSFSSRFENSNSQFDIPQKNYSASKRNKNTNTTESTLKKTNITQNQNLKSKPKRNFTPKNRTMFTSHTISNNENTNIDFENILENDSRKSLDFNHEVSNLQNLYNKLLFENKEKEKEIIKLKYENEKNGNYLLNLEKLLSKEKQQPKGILINKKNLTQRNNEEENIENNNNKLIIYENNIPVETNQMELIEDIEKIKDFREQMIALTKQNNLNNMQIFEQIKKIENIMEDLKIKINERDENIPLGKNNTYIEAKNSNIEELKDNYNNLLNLIMESIKIKNSEYNILLDVKKGNTDKLMREIEKLRLENEEKDNIINEKNKEINQIKVETEFIKLRDQTNFNETVRNEQKKSDRSDIIEKQKNNKLVREMKKSVKNSVQKIKRNFDMEEVDNQEFVSNIQSQIE